MAGRVDVVIFHQSPRDDDPPLTRMLATAREALLERHRRLFERAGARRVVTVSGAGPAMDAPGDGARSYGAGSFGERLARLVAEERIERLVVMGSGAAPLLELRDARRLVAVAASHDREAATNNRYSSDVCAVSDAEPLRDLPPLPSDNALPRWLEERAGFSVRDLPGRHRLALDLDTPLDLALVALAPRVPSRLAALATAAGLTVPHRAALRELAADPRRELLVFGRSGSRTLAWLERNVRCRVRFLAEERGLRASSPLAIGARAPDGGSANRRPPRATLGRLLDARAPGALGDVVGELADGAIVDSRVLMADRFGPDERDWPAPEDRFASDLLRSESVRDPWLRALTASAAGSPIPILLGSHTLVGPGVPVLLRVDPRVAPLPAPQPAASSARSRM